jgi:hypothetical protein
MRCINAIWPAGPPKDNKPILTKTQNISLSRAGLDAVDIFASSVAETAIFSGTFQSHPYLS